VDAAGAAGGAAAREIGGSDGAWVKEKPLRLKWVDSDVLGEKDVLEFGEVDGDG